jgi:predicted outer membrane protein
VKLPSRQSQSFVALAFILLSYSLRAQQQPGGQVSPPSTPVPPPGTGTPLTHPDTVPTVDPKSDNRELVKRTAPGSEGEFLATARRSIQSQWEYSKLAATKAARADVKAFAVENAKVCEGATRELTAFESHLKVNIPAINDPEFAKKYPQMKAMKSADFDTAYLEQMLNLANLDVALYQSGSRISKDARITGYITRDLPALRTRAQTLAGMKQGAAGSSTSTPSQAAKPAAR